MDLDRVEAEQQVLAEARLVGELLGREVGRRNHADVNGDRLVCPHWNDLPLLQRGQELGLKVERQVADLVEEEGAVVSGLEPADALAGSAGERALGVAAQLGLEQGLAGRAAVDGDQRLVAAPR